MHRRAACGAALALTLATPAVDWTAPVDLGPGREPDAALAPGGNLAIAYRATRAFSIAR